VALGGRSSSSGKKNTPAAGHDPSRFRLAERPLRELDAIRRWLAKHDRCTGKLSVIGFCTGGASR